MFEVLYEANKERGNFASSIVTIGGNIQYIYKTEGTYDLDRILYSESVQYYTGHVQAPTSSQREWQFETSHPFESEYWLVTHNGVLTNENEIRQKYLPLIDNPVDTALIVNLIQYFEFQDDDDSRDPVRYIKSALEIIKGTFALCMIDCESSDVYIARCGSTLFYNRRGEYSSKPGKGFTEVPEGVIYKLNKQTKRWNKVSKFKVESPFLFL